MKNKMKKKFFAGALLLIMVAMYGFVPLPGKVGADFIASIYDASDLISDTDPGAIATHTFTFTLATDMENGGSIQVEFPVGFGTFTDAEVSCPGAGIATVVNGGLTAVCTYATGLASTTPDYVLRVEDVENPAGTGVRYIPIKNMAADGITILDRVTVAVFIIDTVLMTARVDSSLLFVISGVADTEAVNGVGCDVTTTATATPFGVLEVGTAKTVCQQMNVTTNAIDGFVVTVEQDQELTSDSGATINSFRNSPDGTGSSTSQTWQPPTNILDNYATYGHMGLTSNDSDLNSLGGYNSFAPTDTGSELRFAGFNATDPMAVFHHNGPSDGDTSATQNKGTARVLYRAQIASLQEAGDYRNILTYIATAQF